MGGRGGIRLCVSGALALACIAGCWDRFAGPAIRNGYAHPIVVTAIFDGRPPLRFELGSGQTLWQHPPGVEPSEIRIDSSEGATLLVISESAIRATGVSASKSILLVSDDGVRAIDGRREGRQ